MHCRLIALTLWALVALGGSALSGPQEAGSPDSIEARAAAARAEHQAALDKWEAARHSSVAEWEEWEAAMAAYPPAPAPVMATPETPAPDSVFSERMGFALTYWNDGGCRVAGKALTGTYDREADKYNAHAMVRTGPSGGDCERNATSFSVGLERRYEVARGWSAVAKFSADRRSTSAPYALVDAAGNVLTRPDGAASDPVTLPAGAADTIGGYLGISSPLFSGLRITVAGNVVPIEWADEADSFAVHFAIAYDFAENFDFDVWTDVGRDWYGGARASWRPSVASRIGTEISAGYDWGLNSVDGGEPSHQTFAGLPVVIQGAPRDDSWTLGVGITF